MSTNRREVLLAAGGIAAATSMAGSGHAMADRKAPATASILVEVAGVGTFAALAYSWGASNSGTTHVGGGAGAGKANVQDLSLSKYVDASSPKLLKKLLTGGHIPSATVTVRMANRHQIVFALEEVLVTSVSEGGSVDEIRHVEHLTLNFAKVTFGFDGANVAFDVADNTTE